MDIMTLKKIMDSVNALIVSNLGEPVIKRLEDIGYSATVNDSTLIAFSINKVEQEFKYECNIDRIPDQMENVAVDMIAGEFLSVKYANGQLKIGDLDMERAVSSMSMGDSSVSFKDKTDAEKVESMINDLIGVGKKERVYSCIRRIRW